MCNLRILIFNVLSSGLMKLLQLEIAGHCGKRKDSWALFIIVHWLFRYLLGSYVNISLAKASHMINLTSNGLRRASYYVPNYFVDRNNDDCRRKRTSRRNQIFVILKPWNITILTIHSKPKTICVVAWRSLCYTEILFFLKQDLY